MIAPKIDSYITKTCPQCGKEFTTKYSKQLYCSGKCMKEYYAQHGGHGITPKLPDIRVCPGCGIEFDATTTKHYGRFHSQLCYNSNRYKTRLDLRERRKAYLKEWRKKNGNYQRNLRLKALEIVGKGVLKCSRCGCDSVPILEIDHVNGGGSKEYKQKRSHTFYLDIIKRRRAIDDLRILCKPCNQIAYVELKWPQLKGQFKVVWGNDKDKSQ